MSKQRFVKSYMWAFIAAGACLSIYSALNLPLARLDLRLVPLAIITVLVASRFYIPIPRTTGVLTFSDMFIFSAALLYGGEVAVLLAAAENFGGSRLGRKPFSF